MLYTYQITVPANTAEASATDTVAKVTAGTITRVSFRPRPGHAGLLRCRVFERAHQLFPTNTEDSLHGDTFPIEWDESHEIAGEPFELHIKAWNTDDTYAHTFDISFTILPPGATLAAAITRAIAGFLGALSPRRIFGGGT